MRNYIKAAELNIQGGLLLTTLQLNSGLNLISGENGTFKTKVLQSIMSGSGLHLLASTPALRMQAISPKRNAQRRAFEQVYAQLRQQNTKLEGLLSQKPIQDGGFQEYPALGDLFYVFYEDLCRDGGNQIEKMEQATAQFNSVIGRVFPHYKLLATWNSSSGSPRIELRKHDKTTIPLEGLSLGEQDILALTTNIYSSRNQYDVFLIDEPEVHLNWHLEEKLFEFFDDLCEAHSKQMVVVTHSRTVFKQRFLPKTQFFYWTPEGKVTVSKEVAAEQRRRIAGDAIEIVKLGEVSKPTFFVEDRHHAVVVEEIANALGVEVLISPCNNKSNVRSLFRFSELDGSWTRSYFVEDGDGEGNPFPAAPAFIHLEKYCIESYLLNVEIVASICGITEERVRELILAAVLANSEQIFKKNRFFEFLVGYLTTSHLTTDNLAKLDASVIIDPLLSSLGKEFRDLVRAYIAECKRRGTLEQELPGGIVRALLNAMSDSASIK